MRFKNKIYKILLPLFPESKELQKHWWHKAIKLVVIVTSASSLYSILWIVCLFYFMPSSWMDSPLYPPLYHLSYLIAYIPMNITSFLSRFPIYQNLFHSLLPTPIIGPIALILILILLLYIIPSLLYRLGLYLYQRFYLIQVKIILLAVLLGLGLFLFSTWKYQQLVNKGTMIADEQCLKVNPLIIERKNNYINSMKVIVASGSAEEYWAETKKYLDTSKRYIEAEKVWLATQKSYIVNKDFNTYSPSYVREAAQAQYDSREAEMKATSAIVELFETYKDIDEEKQKTLSDTILKEAKKSKDSSDKYDQFFNNPNLKMDFRENFIIIPQSKCPPENFNIPDVRDLFSPEPIPLHSGLPIS